MPDFSINDEQIKAVATKLNDVVDSFAADKAIGLLGISIGGFGSLSLTLTYTDFMTKIGKRRTTIESWHASTDAALHDTAKQSKQNDQQWAALFRSDLNQPL
ncbi:MAG: hypothetical protein HXK10_04170 [Actinomyces sp.]|nr:hypothetical protein [Actinomyces sp.]